MVLFGKFIALSILLLGQAAEPPAVPAPPSPTDAADWEPVLVPEPPDILAKLIEGAEKNGAAELKSQMKKEGTLVSSHHLRSATYVGTWSSGPAQLHLVQMTYLTSSPKGQDKIPAKAHPYLVFFDEKFKPTVFWRLDAVGPFEIEGSELKLEGETVFDVNDLPVVGGIPLGGKSMPLPLPLPIPGAPGG
jgi:hypothetical protein